MRFGPRLAALIAGMLAVSAAPAQAVYSEVTHWGSAGGGDGQFNRPRGLAADTSGDLWVADALNNRIQRFSSDGVFEAKFGVPGAGPGQLSGPTDVEVDSDGTLLVADRNNNRVQRFSRAGNFITAYGGPGTGDGQLGHPPSVFAFAGEIYVSDPDNNRVQVFAPGGGFVRKWGSLGTGRGQFGEVFGIAPYTELVTVEDISTTHTEEVPRVAVADSSQRVQVFSTSGTFIRAWGGLGTRDGRFRFAGAADVAGEGSSVFVSDAGNNRVQKFDADGSFIEAIGVGVLKTPRGLAVDADGNLYVSESESNRIRKFRFGPPPPEAGSTGQVETEGGKVKVKKKGSSSFETLEDADTIPIGSTIDASAGTVGLIMDAEAGAVQEADVSKGMFELKQTKGRRPLTELVLKGSLSGCRARGAHAAKRPKSRKLFVKAKGRFRSRGRYSSATVRGTQWTMTDTCSGTLTKVRTGSVTVRDLKRHRNVTVRRGHSYLVRPR